MALPVAEPVFYAAALALVMTGRFGEAEKLIRAQGENSACISDRTRTLSAMISDIRSCMLAREESRHADAYALAEKWHSQFPLQLNLAAIRIQKGLLENGNTAALLAETKALLISYPCNDTLLMLMGKLLEKEGRQEEADAHFRSCGKVTRNGLLLMELKSRTGILCE
jgi:Flp pilus assembly protein TadD